MSLDLILKQSCDGCGSTVELYGSTCKHLTLCVSCGKSMAEKGSKCCECGTPITRLIREYNVRASSSDTNYLIGRFERGLPDFKKKNENKWSLQKGPLGRQFPHALREEYKNKSWLLEEETGQLQYHGMPDGSSPEYYLLVLQGKELVAVPVGCWYTFKKVARRKQLTLKEAEEKMKNRRTVFGYQRWMINVAHSGAAAFGKVENFDGWKGFAPKKESPKEEPVDNSIPLEQITSAAGHRAPSFSKSPNWKRNSSGKESETHNSAPMKKVKIENEVESVEDVTASSTKSSAPIKVATPPALSESGPALPTGPVSEDEIRAVLLH